MAPEHRDIKPENITLDLDEAELTRWKDAAARDGATNLDQWIRVLVLARMNEQRKG